MKQEKLAPALDGRVGCLRYDVQRIADELGKVRCWLTGFQAAGKEAPPGEDSLREAQILLRRIRWPVAK